MRARAHVGIGILGFACLSAAKGIPLTVTGALAAAAGSLFPDLDSPKSALSRSLTPVFSGTAFGYLLTGAALLAAAYYTGIKYLAVAGAAVLFFTVLRHRGFTHSIAGAALFATLVNYYLPELAVPFAVGYILHLLADLLYGGVPLFYPYALRIKLPFSVPTNTFVGNAIEYAVLFCLFVYTARFFV